MRKLWDRMIQKSKCYKNLFEQLCLWKEKYMKVKTMYDKQHSLFLEQVENFNKQIKENKTLARRIIRLTNSLLKKDDLVPTKKQIQSLCHEIIKGE